MLRHCVAGPAGLESSFLHGVGLEESIQVPLLTPLAAVVVVMELAVLKINDDGIFPIGKRHHEAGGVAAEKCGRTGCWFGKSKTYARGDLLNLIDGEVDSQGTQGLP